MIDNDLLASRINDLAIQKGIKRSKALIESGAGKDFVVNIVNKGQKPALDKVVLLAQYFNVSVDYLIGYTPSQEVNPQTQKLIDFASKLTSTQVDSLIESYSKLLDSMK